MLGALKFSSYCLYGALVCALAATALYAVYAAGLFRDEGARHQDVEVHVQAVKQPAQPSGDPGLPLLGGQITQARKMASRFAGIRIKTSAGRLE